MGEKKQNRETPGLNRREFLRNAQRISVGTLGISMVSLFGCKTTPSRVDDNGKSDKLDSNDKNDHVEIVPQKMEEISIELRCVDCTNQCTKDCIACTGCTSSCIKTCTSSCTGCTSSCIKNCTSSCVSGCTMACITQCTMCTSSCIANCTVCIGCTACTRMCVTYCIYCTIYTG